jgi:hypothetical protein
LSNATLPLGTTTSGTLARAIQSALVAVISGERTAEQAAQEVLAQAAGG